jgi:hypothetical protein
MMMLLVNGDDVKVVHGLLARKLRVVQPALTTHTTASVSVSVSGGVRTSG